ncbi:hypothetical protein [Nocardia abscessus]|uniref:hypothetical protein n=1 Tax=Nocardia abscessus TaxID=120957 RepID=UPI0024585928|nr:hypothetical protein [Nocardia abscessus]
MTKAEQDLEVSQDRLSEASKSDQRSSVGWYKLHNDLDVPVEVVRAAGPSGTRLGVVSVAPGTTSEQFDDGSTIYCWLGTSTRQIFDCAYPYTVWYHFSGNLRGNQVNNLSWFK